MGFPKGPAVHGESRSGLLSALSHWECPSPRLLVRPVLWTRAAVLGVCQNVYRVVVCEPLFKSYCTQHGKRLRTGHFVPYIQGRGDILLGDDVHIEGRLDIAFAARFADRPTLEVGDQTVIGDGFQLTIGRRITIGHRCQIESEVRIYDASGHPTDPSDRLAGLPPPEDSASPIVIEDDVRIGMGAIILKGVKIGAGATVERGTIVVKDVPPFARVAGNPARVVTSS